MIRTFKDEGTEAIFAGNFVKGSDNQIQQRVREKLKYLDSAADLRDLMIPPSNQLEILNGDRTDQYSIRIEKQWRRCFEWKDGDPDSKGGKPGSRDQNARRESRKIDRALGNGLRIAALRGRFTWPRQAHPVIRAG